MTLSLIMSYLIELYQFKRKNKQFLMHLFIAV
jgi:hypothetical protein